MSRTLSSERNCARHQFAQNKRTRTYSLHSVGIHRRKWTLSNHKMKSVRPASWSASSVKMGNTKNYMYGIRSAAETVLGCWHHPERVHTYGSRAALPTVQEKIQAKFEGQEKSKPELRRPMSNPLFPFHPRDTSSPLREFIRSTHGSCPSPQEGCKMNAPTALSFSRLSSVRIMKKQHILPQVDQKLDWVDGGWIAYKSQPPSPPVRLSLTSRSSSLATFGSERDKRVNGSKTPIRRVNFADELGKRLTSVHHYGGENQDVHTKRQNTILSAECDVGQWASCFVMSPEAFGWTGVGNYSTSDGLIPRATKPLTPDSNLSDMSPTRWCSWHLSFPQPASQYLRFGERLKMEVVILAGVLIKPATVTSQQTYTDDVNGLTVESEKVVGVVRVANLAYEKLVVIRLTANDWLDYEDHVATYTPPLGRDAKYNMFDLFTFQIPLPTNAHRVEFAIKYSWGVNACGGTAWDNNEGRNYALVHDAPDYGDKSEAANTVSLQTDSTLKLGMKFGALSVHHST